MMLRGRGNASDLLTPKSAAAFAVTFLVAATALTGLLVSNKHSYQPRRGLVCPNDGPVDFAALVGSKRPWKPRDPEDLVVWQRVRSSIASRPSADAAAIRIWVEGTLMPSRSKIVAAKTRDGIWMLSLDRDGQLPARHQAHAQITLSKDQGDGLERMLADPCLYAEPEIIANDYPTLDGKPGACFDGANTFVDIYFGGRRRTAVQACETYGLTGKLVDLIREPLKHI